MRVLLFSGGIDSTAVAWMEKPDRLLFIDYGQMAARGEQRAAVALATALALPLDIRHANLAGFGAGTMVGGTPANAEAPEFWPFRNQMLATLAVMSYASREPLEVMIGTVAGDLIHPDGTSSFVGSMSRVLAAQGAYSFVAPAMNLTADELLERARLPARLLGWTFSCHTGEWACGQCRGCRKHDELKARWIDLSALR